MGIQFSVAHKASGSIGFSCLLQGLKGFQELHMPQEQPKINLKLVKKNGKSLTTGGMCENVQ